MTEFQIHGMDLYDLISEDYRTLNWPADCALPEVVRLELQTIADRLSVILTEVLEEAK